MLIDNMYDYNPNINTPSPYDPNNNNLEIIGDEQDSIDNTPKPDFKLEESMENKLVENLEDKKLKTRC